MTMSVRYPGQRTRESDWSHTSPTVQLPLPCPCAGGKPVDHRIDVEDNYETAECLRCGAINATSLDGRQDPGHTDIVTATVGALLTILVSLAAALDEHPRQVAAGVWTCTVGVAAVWVAARNDPACNGRHVR